MNNSQFTLSIDWEDFGQLLCRDHHNIVTPPLEDIARQTDIILNLLDETNVKATFFILGMLAKYRPDLVKKIASNGHEIGIHGQNHIAMNTLSYKESFNDLQDSLKLVSDITSKPIFGYRAPYFSINKNNLYVLEHLSELGLEYDSSIFPKKMPRYGIENFSTEDKLYELPNGKQIVELPITVLKARNKKYPIAGGGYIRLMPLFLLKNVYQKLEKQGENPMIYMHPYEFDSKRIDCTVNYPSDISYSKIHTFFINLRWNLFRKSIYKKIKYLLENYNFITCKQRADYVKNKAYSPTILG